MRWGKAWIVARKDMAEFRTNKYILFTLVGPPVIFAIVMPITFLAPLDLIVGEQVEEPYEFSWTTDTVIRDQEIIGASYTHVHLENVTLREASLFECYVGNSTVSYSVVNRSVLVGVAADNALIFNSNVEGLEAGPRVGLAEVFQAGVEDEDLAFYVATISITLLMFLVMMPAIIPTVIASYTFVGEKLSRSLEPLLATPTTDAELLAGKSLAIFLPAMAVTWLSFVPMAILVEVFLTPRVGESPLLTPTWIIGLLLLAPLFCALSISFNVFVSSKVSDVRASQQLGVIVVLPLMAIFFIPLTGTIALGALSMLVFAAAIGAAAAGVTALSLKTFRREEILVRWK
jgi:ABC-2 type transport system permease protein